MDTSIPPLPLHNAVCEIAADYTKKKNVLRLKLPDGSEYLFLTLSAADMQNWQSKIQFSAGM
jgi:spectrin beta